MGPDHRNHLVLLKELPSQFAPEEVRTPSDFIMFYEAFTRTGFVIYRVSPHQVAEQTRFWYLPKTVDLLHIFQLSLEQQLRF